jgi:hypothetical protein
MRLKEMPRKGPVEGSRTGWFAAAVIAFFAIAAAAISPARAQASESFDDNTAPASWPAFCDAIDCPPPPPAYTPPGWIPENVMAATSVVSAPLPQAVMTGLFMLGGNWVMTRLWKKRKI